jgi:hypothetical protein
MARVADGRRAARQCVPVEQWREVFVQDLQDNHDVYLRMDVAASIIIFISCSVGSLGCLPSRQLRKFLNSFIGCARADYALSTIHVIMAALQRWAADEFDMPLLAYEPLVVRAMQVNLNHNVVAREAVLTARQKLPMLIDHLCDAVAHLEGLDSFVGVRDSAMLQVGWVGMLRASELVGPAWEQVHFTQKGGVMLYIPQSKTDPGEGAWVLLAGPGGRADPVAALRRLRARGGGVLVVQCFGRVKRARPLCRRRPWL